MVTVRRQSTADGWQKKSAGKRSWVPEWRSVRGGNVVMSGKMIDVIRGSRIDVAKRLVLERIDARGSEGQGLRA